MAVPLETQISTRLVAGEQGLHELQGAIVKAQTRFLNSQEVHKLLLAADAGLLVPSSAPPDAPPAPGQLYVYSRSACRHFRKDHVEWATRVGSRAINESHEKFRVLGAPGVTLSVYYAVSADGALHRRIFWRIHTAPGGGGRVRGGAAAASAASAPAPAMRTRASSASPATVEDGEEGGEGGDASELRRGLMPAAGLEERDDFVLVHYLAAEDARASAHESSSRSRGRVNPAAGSRPGGPSRNVPSHLGPGRPQLPTPGAGPLLRGMAPGGAGHLQPLPHSGPAGGQAPGYQLLAAGHGGPALPGSQQQQFSGYPGAPSHFQSPLFGGPSPGVSLMLGPDGQLQQTSQHFQQQQQQQQQHTMAYLPQGPAAGGGGAPHVVSHILLPHGMSLAQLSPAALQQLLGLHAVLQVPYSSGGDAGVGWPLQHGQQHLQQVVQPHHQQVQLQPQGAMQVPPVAAPQGVGSGLLPGAVLVLQPPSQQQPQHQQQQEQQWHNQPLVLQPQVQQLQQLQQHPPRSHHVSLSPSMSGVEVTEQQQGLRQAGEAPTLGGPQPVAQAAREGAHSQQPDQAAQNPSLIRLSPLVGSAGQQQQQVGAAAPLTAAQSDPSPMLQHMADRQVGLAQDGKDGGGVVELNPLLAAGAQMLMKQLEVESAQPGSGSGNATQHDLSSRGRTASNPPSLENLFSARPKRVRGLQAAAALADRGESGEDSAMEDAAQGAGQGMGVVVQGAGIAPGILQLRPDLSAGGAGSGSNSPGLLLPQPPLHGGMLQLGAPNAAVQQHTAATITLAPAQLHAQPENPSQAAATAQPQAGGMGADALPQQLLTPGLLQLQRVAAQMLLAGPIPASPGATAALGGSDLGASGLGASDSGSNIAAGASSSGHTAIRSADAVIQPEPPAALQLLQRPHTLSASSLSASHLMQQDVQLGGGGGPGSAGGPPEARAAGRTSSLTGMTYPGPPPNLTLAPQVLPPGALVSAAHLGPSPLVPNAAALHAASGHRSLLLSPPLPAQGLRGTEPGAAPVLGAGSLSTSQVDVRTESDRIAATGRSSSFSSYGLSRLQLASSRNSGVLPDPLLCDVSTALAVPLPEPPAACGALGQQAQQGPVQEQQQQQEQEQGPQQQQQQPPRRVFGLDLSRRD